MDAHKDGELLEEYANNNRNENDKTERYHIRKPNILM